MARDCPSAVEFLKNRRTFVFLDEWLTYGFLVMLYMLQVETWVFAAAVGLGVIANGIAYRDLWRLYAKYEDSAMRCDQ